MKKLLILSLIAIIGLIAFVYMFPSDDEIRASRVLSGCWDEELKVCKEGNKGDKCTFGVYELCAAKHPEMQSIFEGRLNACSDWHDGTALDNPDILECTGIKTQRPDEFCNEKHDKYEAIHECIESFKIKKETI